MGVGSTATGIAQSKKLRQLLTMVPLAIYGLLALLSPIFALTLGFNLICRIAISCVALIPIGLLLGLFFPLGMRHFGDEAKPWYWAVNGAFGVVASVMSLALSMEYGYSLVGTISVLGYVLAVACLLGQQTMTTAHA